MKKLITGVLSGLLIGVLSGLIRLIKINSEIEDAEKTAEEIYNKIKEEYPDLTDEQLKEKIREVQKILKFVNNYGEKAGEEKRLADIIVETMKEGT